MTDAIKCNECTQEDGWSMNDCLPCAKNVREPTPEHPSALISLLEGKLEKWKGLSAKHEARSSDCEVGSEKRRNSLALRILCDLAIADLTKIKGAF